MEIGDRVVIAGPVWAWGDDHIAQYRGKEYVIFSRHGDILEQTRRNYGLGEATCFFLQDLRSGFHPEFSVQESSLRFASGGFGRWFKEHK